MILLLVRRPFGSVLERLALVEELGFDWVSFSEHHYSARTLCPSPIVMASHVATHLHKITIAVLGPIIPLSNPVRAAEELAMLDTLKGRLVVGLLRGTTNEYLVYSVKPEEAREHTMEGMELILKAWTEPHLFSWEGRHFQYRTVSVWPRPLQQPYPPTYALGTSRESCEFAVREHLGLGVSFGPLTLSARRRATIVSMCPARLGAIAGTNYLSCQQTHRPKGRGSPGGPATTATACGGTPPHDRACGTPHETGF